MAQLLHYYLINKQMTSGWSASLTLHLSLISQVSVYYQETVMLLRAMIKLGIKGNRHKIRMQRMISWMCMNGLGA